MSQTRLFLGLIALHDPNRPLRSEVPKDLIRLTPKRVGLFENWESFAKVEGDEGAAIANKLLDHFLITGNENDKCVAAALKNVDDLVILVEYYNSNLFVEFKIGLGVGTYIALGSRLITSMLAKSTARSDHFYTYAFA